MTYRIATAAGLLILIAAPVCAADKAATRPATPATAPATRPAVDPATRKILDDLEKIGGEHATIAAELDYRVDDRMTGDVEARTGAVEYKKAVGKEPAKFHVRFDTLQQGKGKRFKDKIEYGFDGAYLTVKKHRVKQMTRYQTVAKGEKAQPLRLGKGPFPVPFGQKADDILKYFQVRTRPSGAKDPKNTDYLHLTPFPQYRDQINFLRLEMWIDRKLRLPVQVRTRDKSKKTTTAVFKKIRVGQKIPDKTFHMDRPLGWEYKVEPLREGEGPRAP